jgi:hypothetical protein
MKAYINRDTLIKLIKKHTVFSKAKDLPAHFRWFQFEDGFLTWDFAIMDKVLIDVEETEFSSLINKQLNGNTMCFGKSFKTQIPPEQKARDLLDRLGVDNAQSYSAGELGELANLIVKAES